MIGKVGPMIQLPELMEEFLFSYDLGFRIAQRVLGEQSTAFTYFDLWFSNISERDNEINSKDTAA